MSISEKHQQALNSINSGNLVLGAQQLSEALGSAETSELWNDWAVVQLQRNLLEEAEEGFRRALELDNLNFQAALNLGVLLHSTQHWEEAAPLLEQALPGLSRNERETVTDLISSARKNAGDGGANSKKQCRDLLLSCVNSDPNEQDYFKTHLPRYLDTLDLLPPAKEGETLLELGSGFFHLTPALSTVKGYAVQCSDVWSGEATRVQEITSWDRKETRTFQVLNFDVERTPWPIADASYDVVSFCEMLEHLVFDPMAVVSEINRVLKPGGRLLLTTPNIASLRSFKQALAGSSPYVYGKFEIGGRPTDRHNREYSATEVEDLLRFGGFAVEKLLTRDSWGGGDRSLLRFLAMRNVSIARRGENTLCLARKTGAVVDRYPDQFFQKHGIQSERRTQQTEAAKDVEMSRSARKKTDVQDMPQSILFVHEIIPQPDHNGCDVRIMQVLRELVRQGHRVTFLARCGTYFKGPQERWPEYIQALEELGIAVVGHDNGRIRFLGKHASTSGTLAEFLRGANFDFAILMTWFWSAQTAPEEYMPEIRKHSPRTRVVVVSDDIHGLREQREAEVRDCWVTAERGEDYLDRETESYRNADLVFTVTELDRSRLLKLAPEAETDVLPMIAEQAPAGPGFDARADFMFVGNFQYSQNIDGAKWLFEKVWPLVHRELPDAKFKLIGSQISPGFGAGVEGVAVLGQVPDLEPLFATSRVFASPILFGTGIKTKNVIAAAHGLPLVTTSVGAEGMNMTDGVNALIGDTPEEFAQAMIKAYRDRELWQRLATNGRKHIGEEFGSKRLADSVRRMARKVQTITPKPYIDHPKPQGIVLRQFPEILTYVPAYNEGALLLTGFLKCADRLLAGNKPHDALIQLRFAHGMLVKEFNEVAIGPYILRKFSEVYRMLGRPERAQTFERQVAKKSFSTESTLPRRGDCAGPELSVILPTRDGAKKLQATFAQLAMQSLHPDRWEVIVVDDGSCDGTESFCKDILPFCNLVYVRQKQLGMGAARRVGAERARGKFLLFLENDTTPRRRFLEGHLRAQYELEEAKAVICGHRDLPPRAELRPILQFCSMFPSFFAAQLATGVPSGINPLSACNLSIRKDALMELASFDENFAFADDVELGIRLQRHGYEVRWDERARATRNITGIKLPEIVQQADRYAQAQVLLFRKHPEIQASGAGVFGHLKPTDVEELRRRCEAKRNTVNEWISTLQTLDDTYLQLSPESTQGGKDTFEQVLKAVGQGLSAIFEFYFLSSFLQLFEADLTIPERMRNDESAVLESRYV